MQMRRRIHAYITSSPTLAPTQSKGIYEEEYTCR
jgi:hypothetical protein